MLETLLFSSLPPTSLFCLRGCHTPQSRLVLNPGDFFGWTSECWDYRLSHHIWLYLHPGKDSVLHEKEFYGAGEMTWWFKAPAALTKDTGSLWNRLHFLTALRKWGSTSGIPTPAARAATFPHLPFQRPTEGRTSHSSEDL